MIRELDDILIDICEHDPRYSEQAYEFVLECLNYAQKKFRRAKHVTGKELLEAIKIQAMRQFGPMALTVLHHWGLKTTEDFGHIVFNLVSRKVLSKTEEDKIEDFKEVYNFEQIFKEAYQKRLEKDVSRLR